MSQPNTLETLFGGTLPEDRKIDRLKTALQRIASLGEKNVAKYAQEIAREALDK